MLIEIHLNPREQAFCRRLAWWKTNASRWMGLRDRRMGNLDPEVMELEGVGSEMAFCKKFKVRASFDVGCRPRSYDCVVAGQRVDVKWSQYENAHLVVALWKKENPADQYVLMRGRFPDYIYCGHKAAKEVFADGNKRTMPPLIGYVLSQGELDFSLRP